MSLPRLPPRGNPTPTASTEMNYADRQKARAALSALAPSAGQSLSTFTDIWIQTMREAGFDSREIAAAKAALVRLVDLGAELPAVAAIAKPIAAIAPTAPAPVEKRRDPRAPVVIETPLHPSDDDLDPDYHAHTAEPEPAADPYDDERDNQVIEPPHLREPEPAVQTTPPPAVALARPATGPSPTVQDYIRALRTQKPQVDPNRAVPSPGSTPPIRPRIPRPGPGLE
jgi:hypothetical protein